MIHLFFDLDHTLLDDTHTKDHYLPKLYAAFQNHIEGDYAAFRTAWTAAIPRHYQRYVDGELSFDEQRHERIREAFGRPLTPALVREADECFLTHFEASWTLFEGWKEYFQRSGLPRGLITNGNGPQQRRKLAKLGLTDVFSPLIISEEVGTAKPKPAVFELALSRAGAAADQAIMVGDSLALDVLGAWNVGMTAFWINHNDAPVPGLHGRFEVFSRVPDLIARLDAI